MSSLHILDVDIENRPLAYLGQDFTTAEITAIGACWHDEPDTLKVWLLGRDKPKVMLEGFRALYDKADIVTGHYIRKHDLPIINGAMIEYGLPPLAEKLTVDTKMDLMKHWYLSASQENLCETLGVPAAKVHMSNAKWLEANRLTKEGLGLTAERVIGDIIQHMALRNILVERGLLTEPRVWRP